MKVGNNNGQLRIATPPWVAHLKPPGPKFKQIDFPVIGQQSQQCYVGAYHLENKMTENIKYNQIKYQISNKNQGKQNKT